MADDFTLNSMANRGAAHPNPAYDFLTGFAPRKVKDLFRWVEYLFYNHPAIFAAMQKLAAYVVTTIKFETESQALEDKWREQLVRRMRIKETGMETNLDRRLYGNSFISVYRPFNRFLICNDPSCKARTGIAKAGKYQFQLKTLAFKYTCAGCKKPTVGTIFDQPSKDAERIRVIRWDAKLMDIDYNPMTGRSEYYYTVPGDIANKVTKNNRHVINGMPYEFLVAIRDKKKFKFAPNKIFHMKMTSPSGIDAQWGLPPLTSAIKLFFNAMVLRKANEAIALDYIVPFRVLHPAPISGNAEPASQMNLALWMENTKKEIAHWRRDPLHIMFAPAALGVTTMGGQARSLMTLPEIQNADENILAAMNIPKEFVFGGLTVNGSGIALRMLENQLETDANDLNEQLRWIMKEVASIMEWPTVEAKYVPFRLVDDTEQKQLLLSVNQMYPGKVPFETVSQHLDLDAKAMREASKQEAIDDARMQMETQQALDKLQNSAAVQAQQAADAGQGLNYDMQAIMAQADQMAQQLKAMDPGSRQSQLAQLSQEDPVMYACTKDRLETLAQMDRQQATQALKVS